MKTYRMIKEFLEFDPAMKGGNYHIYLLHDMIKLLTYVVLGISSFLSGVILILTLMNLWLYI